MIQRVSLIARADFRERVDSPSCEWDNSNGLVRRLLQAKNSWRVEKAYLTGLDFQRPLQLCPFFSKAYEGARQDTMEERRLGRPSVCQKRHWLSRRQPAEMLVIAGQDIEGSIYRIKAFPGNNGPR